IVAEIDGERYDLVGRSTEAIVDLGISLVPEGRRLFPKMTGEENLLLGAFRPLARTAIAHNLDSSSETFPVLRERRRAADARLGARSEVGAQDPADRRAFGRPCACPRQAHDRKDQGIEGPL